MYKCITVSTIPEETEEQLLERSLRVLDQQHLLKQQQQQLKQHQKQQQSAPKEENRTELRNNDEVSKLSGADKTVPIEASDRKGKVNELNQRIKDQDQDVSGSSSSNRRSLSSTKKSSSSSKRPSSARQASPTERPLSSRRPSSTTFDSRENQKENFSEEVKESEAQTEMHEEPLQTSESVGEQREETRISPQEESTPKEEADRMPTSPFHTPQSSRNDTPTTPKKEKKATGLNINLTHEFADIDPPKRKIQEPQRTPRIQEPNSLVIQFEPPAKEIQESGSSNRKSSTSRRKSSMQSQGSKRSVNSKQTESIGGRSGKASSGRRRSSQLSCKSAEARPTTRESTFSVTVDYYSDDFDEADSLSGSDFDDGRLGYMIVGDRGGKSEQKLTWMNALQHDKSRFAN